MGRILVVEDSPTNMMLTVEILGFGKHTVLQASNAAAGIDIARKEQPDLILMDIQLPDMDGVEATKILKADAETRDIPVIALTASIKNGEESILLAAGFDACITKPIRYKELLARVDRVVNRSSDPNDD